MKNPIIILGIIALIAGGCFGQITNKQISNNSNSMSKKTSEFRAAMIQAVLTQDEDFLKKNLTPENVNNIYEFPVTRQMRVYLSDGTEETDFFDDVDEITLLFFAAQKNLPVSVKILIEKGADVNAKDLEGRTPLIAIVKEPDTEVVQRILIENKASVDFYISWHEDPVLHYYIENEKFELAELAIEHGADVNIKNRYSMSVLEIAEKHGTPKIVSMLKERGAKK
jgi:hypothetical protein